MALLRAVLESLVPQVDGLVLVDNGSGSQCQADLSELLAGPGAQLLENQSLFLPENIGIGAAQNQGIARAIEALGADYILLCDHDSLPAADMVARLHRARRLCGADPAAVGPDFTEPGRDRAGILAAGSAEVEPCEAVIASGALIPVAALRAIGPFDADLFIDFVDTEWCFRARGAGWGCYVARDARMQHRIGAPGPLILGRRMALHSPERMYYQLRNLFLLMRHADVPRGWALRMLPRYLGRSLLLSLLCPPRRQRAGHVLLGLWHGLRGRRGALGA